VPDAYGLFAPREPLSCIVERNVTVSELRVGRCEFRRCLQIREIAPSQAVGLVGAPADGLRQPLS
jgi:hypothetical protein